MCVCVFFNQASLFAVKFDINCDRSTCCNVVSVYLELVSIVKGGNNNAAKAFKARAEIKICSTSDSLRGIELIIYY